MAFISINLARRELENKYTLHSLLHFLGKFIRNHETIPFLCTSNGVQYNIRTVNLL